MIDFKELRIGNLIEAAFLTCPVLEISEKHATVDNPAKYNGIDRLKVTPDLVYPIHITEYWLLKFGFEKVKHWQDYTFKNYTLRHNSEDKNWWLVTQIDVSDEIQIGINFFYVHQLQNLYFALTNTELTIKENVQA